jgi:hypothetical protein
LLIRAIGIRKVFEAALKEKKTAEANLRVKKTDATPVTREIAASAGTRRPGP